ncbi:MAG: hypothetical protein CMF23_14335 [Ignavibacteriae bacterium]|nr:hypothetical protein [Ignavibacteriota bacterium]
MKKFSGLKNPNNEGEGLLLKIPDFISTFLSKSDLNCPKIETESRMKIYINFFMILPFIFLFFNKEV